MVEEHDNSLKQIVETIIREKTAPVKELLEIVFNHVMKVERAEFLKAGHYERAGTNRLGYATGYKSKRMFEKD